MYEKYMYPRIKTVEFYVRTSMKYTALSITFTVTEFAKTHLQQSRLPKKIFVHHCHIPPPKRNSYIRHCQRQPISV